MVKNYVYLTGKITFCWFTKPDDKFGDPKWHVKFYPNEDSLNIIKDLQTMKDNIRGIKNVLGKDDDGYYMNFSRPQQKLMRGKVVAFTPPFVVNPDGSPFTESAIGHGTDVTLKVEIYTHPIPGGGKAKAARWEGMRIDNLVPFELNRDLIPEQAKQVGPLVAQPAPQF